MRHTFATRTDHAYASSCAGYSRKAGRAEGQELEIKVIVNFDRAGKLGSAKYPVIMNATTGLVLRVVSSMKITMRFC